VETTGWVSFPLASAWCSPISNPNPCGSKKDSEGYMAVHAWPQNSTPTYSGKIELKKRHKICMYENTLEKNILYRKNASTASM